MCKAGTVSSARRRLRGPEMYSKWRRIRMNHSPEKQCNVCGNAYFAFGNHPCPRPRCTGTMCRVITPLPGKRVSGVLCRDKTDSSYYGIWFILGGSLVDLTMLSTGIWKWSFGTTTYRQWTKEQWKNQYGKLPRKGSKSMVIIELTDGQ